MWTPTRVVALICIVLNLPIITVQSQESCSSGTDCGWKAQCKDSNCFCPADYVLHQDGKNCRNASCIISDCLLCDKPDKCIKCVSFISKSSGVCLKMCVGSAELQGDNLVCTESVDDGIKVNLVIAIVSGVGAGLVICVVVIIVACVCVRRNRRNVNLKNKSYTVRQMETGSIRQLPVYENNAYEDEDYPKGSGKIDPEEYLGHLDKLRPYTDTLMKLLSQVRSKTRAMNASDPRVPTYKGVIHRLCRVLVLLHKKDPVVSIPSDAIGLIQWAHQMLEDQQLSASDSNIELNMAQISSVDLEMEEPVGPIYMTPESNQPDVYQVTATPYSTVPVPLATQSSYQSNTLPKKSAEKSYQSNTLGRKSGFATINRAPSVANAALLCSLEAGEKNMLSLTPPEQPSPPQPISNGKVREDLQIFLINIRGVPSTVANTRGLPSTVTNTRGLPSTVANTNADVVDGSYITSAYDVGSVKTLPILGKKNSAGNINKPVRNLGSNFISQTNTFSQPAGAQKVSVFKPSLGGTSQPSAKKNIITNPNTVNKSATLGGKNSKYAVPNIGYFANGHYYDPNPMPDPDTEVYAPGSSYSDRSNVMSTFLGDIPRSISSSDQSEDGDDGSENSEGDLDTFPFDPKDATEPVEV
ncbi:unnamed protein product [Lymnaea stagnalis]|uniref:Uncharacterized protein n=1 Tax=Lymnaea stagnalis TaxID=6523 RepID=A0AAV2H8Z9_LYMST